MASSGSRPAARRSLTAGLVALPVAAAAGLLAWQLPRGGEEAPLPVEVTGPPGALTMGATSYKIPDAAVIVAPSGDDASPGSAGKPVRTVAKAIAKARDGDTIVLRAGTYHESVTVPEGKRLTIQAHPGEPVWFDGSSAVDGWERADGAWVKRGWTHRFDHSPTYSKGAPQNSDPDFQFVDPEYPMAAHPDQVWIDGRPQRQVGKRAQVEEGTFYVDEEGDRLYLGSDPGGRKVRASTLGEAITIRGAGSTLRGIGVRRYATSLPDLGTVKAVADRVTVENVAVTDSATQGLSVLGKRARIRQVTTARNGLLGIHANHADDLRIELARSTGNNTERFKQSPVSGGIKITRSRTVSVTRSVLDGNRGKGVWLDESVHGITVAGNRILNNAGHAVVLELSAKAVVAGNLIRGNGGDGMKINNTAGVRIWNNTLAGNGRTVHLVQDDRSPDKPGTPGRDPRQPFPDPTMTWRLGEITVSSNVLADAKDGAPCLLCVEDHTHKRSGGEMKIEVDGNLYARPDAGSPEHLAVWSRGEGEPHRLGDLAAFKAKTGQEDHGLAYDSAEAVGRDGALGRKAAADAARAARPLPEPIAKLLGKKGGVRHMGTWNINAV
ncbi:right-handed parallel beta-helix repeat-containing protein [Spirillospora sp. NPDC029432]|uniref:right-handed parallel beta-helix repeat-containing protein n=1 Tax=Spirillospora sp. NPDC029432 TaxID=3154599 RepID=UPI0034514F7B